MQFHEIGLVPRSQYGEQLEGTMVRELSNYMWAGRAEQAINARSRHNGGLEHSPRLDDLPVLNMNVGQLGSQPRP